MLIIAGTFKVDPDKRQTFIDSTEPLVTSSLDEAGCQAYTFSADPLDEDTVNLFEIWDNQECLTPHEDSIHLNAWRDQWGHLIEQKQTLKYQVSSVDPVRD